LEYEIVNYWVWDSLFGFDYTLELAEVILRAGEALVYTEVWDQRTNQGEPITPGEYQTFAMVREGEPSRELTTAPKPFTVSP
jgi:hypothetical protein